MLEVFGKNFLRKSRRIPYLERVLLAPPTDILRGLILHLDKELTFSISQRVLRKLEILRCLFSIVLLINKLLILYYPSTFHFPPPTHDSRIFLELLIMDHMRGIKPKTI